MITPLRDFQNKPGTTYDADRVQTIFAEDMHQIDDNLSDLQTQIDELPPAGGITLETDSVENTDQTKLNLIAGDNIVLTPDEDGGVTIEALGGGSAPLPKLSWTTDFNLTTRFNKQASGGANSFSGDGLSVGSGSGSAGWALTRFDMAQWGDGTGILRDTDQTFACRFVPYQIGANAAFAFGFGELVNDIAGGNSAFVSKHVGFKIVRTSSGAINLYATQGDGTSETVSSVLTTVAAYDVLELIFRINDDSSVDYWWRKNNGARSAATNLTGNLPTGGERWICFGVSNINSTGENTAFFLNASCEV